MYRPLLIAFLLSMPAFELNIADHRPVSTALVACCDHTLKLTPSNLDLRRQRAHALLDEGDAVGAAAELGAIAEEQPDDAGAWLDYAIALVDDSRFQEAAAAIAHALLLDPSSFEANKVAVIAFEHTGREKDALRANLRLAAAGDRIAMKDVAEALLNGRGTASDPQEAMQWLERAASAGHIGAMNQLAQIYRDGLYGHMPDAVLAAHWSNRAREAD